MQNYKTELQTAVAKALKPFAADIKKIQNAEAEHRAAAAAHNTFSAEDHFEQVRNRAIGGDKGALAEMASAPELRDVKKRFAAIEDLHDRAREAVVENSRPLWQSAAQAMLPVIDKISAAAQKQLDEVSDAIGEPRRESTVAANDCAGLRSWCEAMIAGRDADRSLVNDFIK